MNTLQWNSQERVNAPCFIRSGYMVPLYNSAGELVSESKCHWFMASELADLMLEDIARNWWIEFKSRRVSKDPLDKFAGNGLEAKYGSPPPSLRKLESYNKDSVIAWATKHSAIRNQDETNIILVASYTKHVTSKLSWLNHMMVTRVSANIGVTEFCKIYHSNAIHVMDFNKNGYLEPVAISEIPEGMEMSKPRQLAHGIYSTIECNFFGNIDTFKFPKRVKLIAGPEVDAVVPEITSIRKTNLPLGIMLVSHACANRFQITGRDTGVVYPLQTGDKLVGCLPDGTLVKGTAIVTNTPSVSMVVGYDCDKGNCVYNEYTKLHVQSRAAERLTVGTVNVSYQLGQFIPKLTRARVINQLDLSRRYFEEEYLYGPPLDLDEDGMENRGEFTKAPSIRELVSGNATTAQYADLFYYPVYETVDEDEKVKHVTSSSISAIGSLIIKNNSIKGYEKQVQEKITDLLIKTISFPCRGAWAVAVPLRDWTDHSDPIDGVDDIISMPEDMWIKLGKPSVVALVRYPVKSAVSLVRLHVKTHNDHASIEVSPLVQIVIENGDFDGDQDQIVVDEDVVEQATSVEEAFYACLSAQQGVDIPTFDTSEYTTAQASFKLMSMDKMGMATVCRDILIGKVSENELLSIFEWIVQPGIAGKEGAPYLSPFTDTIDGMTGGEWITSKLPFMSKHLANGKLVSKPSLVLLMCSGNWYKDAEGKGTKPTLSHYIEVANTVTKMIAEGSTNPHSIIISAFSSLVNGFNVKS